MKISKRIRKMLNLYNIAIVVCVVVIVAAICIIFIPSNKNKVTVGGVEVVQTNVNASEEISEEEAKKAAVKQFKKLGESTKIEALKASKIRREGVEYYYITSAENSLEICIKGGKIERVNSVLVEE